MGVLWKVDWLMIAKVVGNNGRDDSDGISEGGGIAKLQNCKRRIWLGKFGACLEHGRRTAI